MLGFLLALLIFLVRPISVMIGFKNKADVQERTFLEVLNPKGLSAVVLASCLPSSELTTAARFQRLFYRR